MIINGVYPSSILPSYDTKPWEIKAIDTKEFWQSEPLNELYFNEKGRN
jgi:hypothetical protein